MSIIGYIQLAEQILQLTNDILSNPQAQQLIEKLSSAAATLVEKLNNKWKKKAERIQKKYLKYSPRNALTESQQGYSTPEKSLSPDRSPSSSTDSN